MDKSESALIFVYNEDSNVLSQFIDYFRKAFAAKKYECHLCSLTLSAFGMRKEWTAFLPRLNLPIIFLYRNQFIRKFRPDDNDRNFPAVFIRTGTTVTLLLSPHDINSCKTLDQLKAKLMARLPEVTSDRAIVAEEEY